jgi:hypothetical protein
VAFHDKEESKHFSDKLKKQLVTTSTTSQQPNKQTKPTKQQRKQSPRRSWAKQPLTTTTRKKQPHFLSIKQKRYKNACVSLKESWLQHP